MNCANNKVKTGLKGVRHETDKAFNFIKYFQP